MATGVPAMISTALAAISNEMDIDSTDSADEFQLSERGLYQNTIRNFTRRISGDSNRRPRGRPSSTVRLNFFLLAEPTPLLPSLEEQRRLTSMGLGTPKEAVPVRRNLSLLEFQQLIHSLYTDVSLELVGFSLGKVTKSKKVKSVMFETVRQLRREIGKGKLLIIPRHRLSTRNDEPTPNPIERNDHEDMPQEQAPNPIERAVDTPPIANRRTCRDAAAAARMRVRGWVQNGSRMRQTSSMPAPGPSSGETPLPERTAVDESAQEMTPLRDVEIPLPEPTATDESQQIPLRDVEIFLPTAVMSQAEFESELDSMHVDGDALLREPAATGTLPEGLRTLARTCFGDRESGFLKIIIRRRNALEDALENVARAQARLLRPLFVRFIDESAVDDGGPSRELSSEVVQQINDSKFVKGRYGGNRQPYISAIH